MLYHYMSLICTVACFYLFFSTWLRTCSTTSNTILVRCAHIHKCPSMSEWSRRKRRAPKCITTSNINMLMDNILYVGSVPRVCKYARVSFFSPLRSVFLIRFLLRSVSEWLMHSIYSYRNVVCASNVWHSVGGEEAKPYMHLAYTSVLCRCAACSRRSCSSECVYAGTDLCWFVLTWIRKKGIVYKPWLAVELRKVERPLENQTTQGCITYMPFPMKFYCTGRLPIFIVRDTDFQRMQW